LIVTEYVQNVCLWREHKLVGIGQLHHQSATTPSCHVFIAHCMFRKLNNFPQECTAKVNKAREVNMSYCLPCCLQWASSY